jgi:hypothetical protein
LAVPKLKTLCAVLLALLWAPVTSHCLLESIGAVPEFLHCAAACAPAEEDHADDETDACASVESPSYKTEERAALVNLPVLTALAATALAAPAPTILSPLPPARADSGSEPGASWRFSRRVAAPPRAPSFPA